MKDIKFIRNYFNEFQKHVTPDESLVEDLLKIKNFFLKIKKDKKKIVVIGNGGSVGIASHFTVDMTKNGKIRCINFNEPGLITCLTNDFSYEEMYAKAINFYGEKGDLLIAISSSGTSPNIIKACAEARKRKFSKIITLSGFPKKTKLKYKGDVNLVVDSRSYNFIENIHQIWLLMLVDLVIGKTEYKVN